MDSESWSDYYQFTGSRPPSPFLLEALARLERDLVGKEERLAIDLGCGAGVEALALLARGWRVLALDKEPSAIAALLARVPTEYRANLGTRVQRFEELDLPPSDMVHAGMSLPFCPPSHFERLWAVITASLSEGGHFVGHFLGSRDSWANSSEMSFQSEEELRTVLGHFEVKVFREIERDGSSFSGPKHWHFFAVIACKLGT